MTSRLESSRWTRHSSTVRLIASAKLLATSALRCSSSSPRCCNSKSASRRAASIGREKNPRSEMSCRTWPSVIVSPICRTAMSMASMLVPVITPAMSFMAYWARAVFTLSRSDNRPRRSVAATSKLFSALPVRLGTCGFSAMMRLGSTCRPLTRNS